jgi:hypothetical protein
MDGEPRARALAALLPELPAAEQVSAEADILTIAESIVEDNRRARVLADLLPNLTGPRRHEAFERMLRSCLGTRVTSTVGVWVDRRRVPRAFLLECVADTGAVLAAIGGEGAVHETARTIIETADW